MTDVMCGVYVAVRAVAITITTLALSVLLMAVMLAGCGASVSGSGDPGGGKHTLSACVHEWNSASIVGAGPSVARDVEARTRPALMFAYSDGFCGLAFPSAGVFVSGLGGDYRLEDNPLVGLTDVLSPTEVRLEAEASRNTNVRVNMSGKVSPSRHETLPTMSYAKLETSAPCAEVGSPDDLTLYEIESSVNCELVRTLIYAWNNNYHTFELVPGRSTATYHLIGWTCVGSELVSGRERPTYKTLRCTRGAEVIEGKYVPPAPTFPPGVE
jgi:hypothetical protein